MLAVLINLTIAVFYVTLQFSTLCVCVCWGGWVGYRNWIKDAILTESHKRLPKVTYDGP